MYYTIGTSILSASTMPLGLIMGRGKILYLCQMYSFRGSSGYHISVFYPKKDKHGCRIMRLIGIIIFFLSTILFTFISWYPSDLSWAVLPAVAMNGVGGIIYVFTSFQLGLYSLNGSSVPQKLLL